MSPRSYSLSLYGRHRRSGRWDRGRAGRPRGRSGAEAARHRLRQPDQDDDQPDHLLHHRARRRLGHARPPRSARSAAWRSATSSSCRPSRWPSAWSSATWSTPARACSSPTSSARPAEAEAAEGGESDTATSCSGIIPTTLVSAFTEGQVLQTLLVALLVGFALQAMGKRAQPILSGIGHIQRLVFRILVHDHVGRPRSARSARWPPSSAPPAWTRSRASRVIMLGFYVTCVLFVFVVLGPLLWAVARVRSSRCCATWAGSSC